MTPEQITAGCLYQCAVLRVYGPWQTCEVLAAAERRRALARVRHARLMPTMRDTGLPHPPALVELNSRPASAN